VIVGCLHLTWKNGVMQCNEMTILTNSFIPFVISTQYGSG